MDQASVAATTTGVIDSESVRGRAALIQVDRSICESSYMKAGMSALGQKQAHAAHKPTSALKSRKFRLLFICALAWPL